MLLIRRIVGASLIAVAVVLAAPGIWVVAAADTISSADTYKNGLADQNIYEDIVPIALPALARALEKEGASPAIITNINTIRSSIDADTWRNITNALVPPDWLQAEVESAIDNTILKLDDPETESYIANVATLQDRLTGRTGEGVIEAIIDGAEPCTNVELETLASLSDTNATGLPVCQPPDDVRPVMVNQLTMLFESFADEIGRWDGTINNLTGWSDYDFETVSMAVETFERTLFLGYLIPLTLLALAVALNVRSYPAFARWVGPTLIAIGIVAMLPLPVIRGEITSESVTVLNESELEPEVRIFLVQLATALQLSAFDNLSEPIVAQSMFAILLGAALLAGAYWLWRKEQRSSLMMTPDGQLYSASGELVGTVQPGSSVVKR
jgi:hypothetical protein